MPAIETTNNKDTPNDAQLPPLQQHSSAADPHLRRYTLTDTPSTPSSTRTFTSEQHDISQAVDELLQTRYSAVVDLNEGDSEETASMFADARSSSGHSDVSDASTVRDLRNRNGIGENSHGHSAEVPFEEPQRAPTVPPYQPGQLLPTIVTGETLNLDEYGQPSPYDAFPDVPPLPHVPLPTTQPYAHYDQNFVDDSTLPPDPSDNYHYMPKHDTPYQHIEPEPLPAGSDGYIDHFQHDTEAYASGNFSRTSYPRSRSPTPAVDEEDYYIVGNESVHYTGYPTPEMPDWDPEKPHYGYPEHGGSLNDKYADAYDHDEQYDDDDDDGQSHMTPISSIQYLEPEAPVETRHFGPAPTGRIHRRHKSKKRVQLTNGNLVVDINVPPKMVLPYRGEPEMTTTRYTAVTCDPDDFEKNGFFLRQNETGRKTELFIVVTMYNVSIAQCL